MIYAYPEAPCVVAGDDAVLHVRADVTDYSVRCVRWGERGDDARTSVELRDGAAVIRTGADWKPGAYITVFENAARDGAVSFDARSGRALFTLRHERPSAPLLVVLPLFTYHAYNVADVDGTLGVSEGECLYSGAKWVSLLRPGGGTGGHPWDEVNADAYDLGSPRQTFAHWDAKALQWLEREGYSYDCCTDLEVHDGSVDLRAYRAFISFGHHEYWTQEMRDAVEGYVASGGNAAFFGGNTCWFRAEYDASSRRIRRAGRWNENPEWRLTGATYACGGGKWIGERPPSGYCIRHPRHWVFAGLQADAGDMFGCEERLIGYECDGAPAESDLEVLAEASIAHWRVGDGSGELSASARASLGLRRPGGWVFTASTVDWARVMAEGERFVTTITRNVLDRFLS